MHACRGVIFPMGLTIYFHTNTKLLNMKIIIVAFDEGERILIMSFFEISPAGFTRRFRVYRRHAIRFQGLDAILGGWMDWLCGTDSLDRMFSPLPL